MHASKLNMRPYKIIQEWELIKMRLDMHNFFSENGLGVTPNWWALDVMPDGSWYDGQVRTTRDRPKQVTQQEIIFWMRSLARPLAFPFRDMIYVNSAVHIFVTSKQEKLLPIVVRWLDSQKELSHFMEMETVP